MLGKRISSVENLNSTRPMRPSALLVERFALGDPLVDHEVHGFGRVEVVGRPDERTDLVRGLLFQLRLDRTIRAISKRMSAAAASGRRPMSRCWRLAFDKVLPRGTSRK